MLALQVLASLVELLPKMILCLGLDALPPGPQQCQACNDDDSSTSSSSSFSSLSSHGSHRQRAHDSPSDAPNDNDASNHDTGDGSEAAPNAPENISVTAVLATGLAPALGP